jgi:transposase-like protein
MAPVELLLEELVLEELLLDEDELLEELLLEELLDDELELLLEVPPIEPVETVSVTRSSLAPSSRLRIRSV